jgi:L-2-hydroxycarboxylate dehydrogenase (NAD+)
MEQLFSYNHLFNFTKNIFLAIGCSDSHANTATVALLAADVRGIVMVWHA